MKGKMVDAAGIEPATPAMSTHVQPVASFVDSRNSLATLSLCSPGVPGLSHGEVHREPSGTVSQHGACCPALALWVLGQIEMARQAAGECGENRDGA